MSIEGQLEAAAVALEEFEELHRDFMTSIANLKEPTVNGAAFQCIDGELNANCVGVKLRTRHRPIAREGKLESLEYTFVANDEVDEVPIWSMYLARDRRLYSDSSLASVICDMTNSYLLSRVAPRLASNLLASKVFAPRA
jgi:hypothetical protein